jgi:hypothetical protein
LRNFLRIADWWADRGPVVFVDGSDWPGIGGGLIGKSWWRKLTCTRGGKPFDIIFKRETDREYDPSCNCWSLNFSIDPSSLPPHISLKKKEHGFAFFASASHPLRRTAEKLLQPYFKDAVFIRDSQPGHRYGSNDYLTRLSSSHVGLSVRGLGFDTLRYWEIPLCRSMLLSEKPTIHIRDNFVHEKSAAFVKNDLGDLVDKARYYSTHAQEADEIGQAGHAHSLKYHLPRHRAEFVLSIIRRSQRAVPTYSFAPDSAKTAMVTKASDSSSQITARASGTPLAFSLILAGQADHAMLECMCRSIAMQSYGNFEVIFCSPPVPAPTAFPLRQIDRHGKHELNQALALAQGEMVIVVHHAFILNRHFLRRCLLHCGPRVFVLPALIGIEKRKINRIMDRISPLRTMHAVRQFLFRPSHADSNGSPFCVHRQHLLEVNGFNEEHAHNANLMIYDAQQRLALKGIRRRFDRSAVLYHERTIDPNAPMPLLQWQMPATYFCQKGLYS